MKRVNLYNFLIILLTWFVKDIDGFSRVYQMHNVQVVTGVAQPFRVWFKQVIKYKIIADNSYLPYHEVEEAIHNAFAQWSSIIPLTFIDVTRTQEKPDIFLAFSNQLCSLVCQQVTRTFGAWYAFTNPGERTVFNTFHQWTYRDTWKILSGQYVDFGTVALHEIGHHLYIPDEYGSPNSIMRMNTLNRHQRDFYGNYIRPGLQPDDIATAQRLYGRR